MRLILIPVILMIFSSVLYQSIALGVTDEHFGADFRTYYDNQTGSGVLDNGTEVQLGVDDTDVTVGFDVTTGVFALFIAVVAVAVVSGITVLGSGLKEVSVKMIIKGVMFYGLWAIISLYGVEGYALMPMGIGWIIYLIYTCVFTIGVFEVGV